MDRVQAEQAMARGADALGRGDLAGAEQAFAAAVAADPTLADGWFNLGWVQRASRRFDEALESYERALAAGIDGAEEVHVNRAAILADHLHISDRAVAEFEQALAVRPNYLPALHGLAQLHEDSGQRAEAGELYRQVLRAVPDNGRARARLALLSQPEKEPSRLVAVIADALARATHAEDRAELLFAQATLLDAAGDHAQAFAAARQANELAAALSPSRYDRQGFEQLVDRLIATFPEPIAPAPADPGGPVFICGLFRSGSTLAEQILGRHPALEAAGELEAIPAIARSLAPYPEAVPMLEAAALERFRGDYALELGRALPGGGRPIDKRCDNYLHLGLIQRLFPGALIVHTKRHPLDNLLSTWFLRFGDGVPYGHRLADAAHHAVQHERLMRHWRNVMPGRIVELDYDLLVREPRQALEPVLWHLGLDWSDELLDPRVRAAVRTASNWQVRQPLHARSSGRWRHYRSELEDARCQLLAGGVEVPD